MKSFDSLLYLLGLNQISIANKIINKNNRILLQEIFLKAFYSLDYLLYTRLRSKTRKQ